MLIYTYLHAYVSVTDIFFFISQGIDLKAGGKSKKTKRTAPKSDDIYLKLLVKVSFEKPVLIFLCLDLFVYVVVFVTDRHRKSMFVLL